MSARDARVDPTTEDELACLRKERDEAYDYAISLAITLATKYPAVREWKPLKDVIGLLSQIDNMACGFIQQRDKAQEKYVALKQENAELRARLTTERDEARLRREMSLEHARAAIATVRNEAPE